MISAFLICGQCDTVPDVGSASISQAETIITRFFEKVKLHRRSFYLIRLNSEILLGDTVSRSSTKPSVVSYISPSPTGTILGLSGGVAMDAWWRLPGGAGAC